MTHISWTLLAGVMLEKYLAILRDFGHFGENWGQFTPFGTIYGQLGPFFQNLTGAHFNEQKSKYGLDYQMLSCMVHKNPWF